MTDADGLPESSVLYTSQSENRKTGNIPQQYIGTSREESRDSCRGCPLLERVCYAQNGTVGHFGHPNMLKSKPIMKRLIKLSDYGFEPMEGHYASYCFSRFSHFMYIEGAAFAAPFLLLKNII